MRIAIGFGGSGDVDSKTVVALLDDLLNSYEQDHKNPEFHFYMPDSVGRKEKGLKNVAAFLEEEFDEEDVSYAIPEEIVDGVESGGDDNGRLLILIPTSHEEPDEMTEMLLENAIEKNIPVKDLTKALDDLDFDEDEDDVPDEEPEEPKRGRGRPRKEEQEQEEAYEEAFKEEEPASGRPDIADGREQVLEGLKYAREAYGDEAQATITSEHGPELVNFEDTDPGPLTIDEQIRRLVKLEVAKQLSAIAEVKIADPVVTPQEPLSGTTTTNDNLVDVIKGENGEYRKKGRGRLRKGDVVTAIPKSEAESLGII